MLRSVPELARIALLAGAFACLGLEARAQAKNDYPTADRADFIFACMAASGQTRESLERCSCSIDVIAELLTHERYVNASTVLAMRQGAGLRGAQFRSVKTYDDIVADLRRAQAEAEVRCYRETTSVRP